MPEPKHLIRTRNLKAADFRTIGHPYNPMGLVSLSALSDRAGMKRVHLALARLAPGKESFAPHAHQAEEEFVFVLEGRGTAIHGDERFEIGPGDYIGYPTDGLAHAIINSGTEDLVYLMGGERSEVDVVHFPAAGRRIMFTRSGPLEVSEAGTRAMAFDEWQPKP